MGVLAHCIDSDEMLQNAAFLQGMNCLPRLKKRGWGAYLEYNVICKFRPVTPQIIQIDHYGAKLDERFYQSKKDPIHVIFGLNKLLQQRLRDLRKRTYASLHCSHTQSMVVDEDLNQN